MSLNPTIRFGTPISAHLLRAAQAVTIARNPSAPHIVRLAATIRRTYRVTAFALAKK